MPRLEISRVHDAYRRAGECPLCSLEAGAEAALLKSFRNARGMEPAVRQRTNREGFCPAHLQRLYAGESKLGLGLVMHTRLGHVAPEACTALEEAGAAAGGRNARREAERAAARLAALSGSCYVCGMLRQDLERWKFTILYLWGKDPEFRPVYRASRGFCIPHFSQMILAAAGWLRADRLKKWLDDSSALLRASLESLDRDLHGFTQLHQADNPALGTAAERSALSRTLQKLAGGEYSAG